MIEIVIKVNGREVKKALIKKDGDFLGVDIFNLVTDEIEYVEREFYNEREVLEYSFQRMMDGECFTDSHA